MMAPLVFLFTAAVAAAAPAAAVRSGHATAEWLAASSTYQPGKPVRTVVRLVVDDGWHTYWLNPGEAGMKVSAEWKLPEGWQAGELEFPVPSRFTAGGLVGFGYTGTVDIPVSFTAPADAAENVTLRGEVSWLTCDDHACIPGKATIELALRPGPPEPTPAAAAVEAARKKVPQPAEGASLAVAQTEKSLKLRIVTEPGKPTFDPAACEVFPVTESAVDPTAKIEFVKTGDGWSATVPVSEYAAGPLEELALVLADRSGRPPVSLVWKLENPR